ncbi:hypothetical protein NAT51_18850 [Flavobacterium amniphilum]|uniref:hypothetical protein n=1 Tax=Flavobacterium amniphilum TaxID=1834035 RepID=UPI002029C7D8|nr:hypothetical protein [Flavobacterium amniphilum]MCL9807589.1 hypothetical protein [Flavobacterium amniphilum]
MLKNILNLEGSQELTNNEQKAINGGIPQGCKRAMLDPNGVACGPGYYLLVRAGVAYCCPV